MKGKFITGILTLAVLLGLLLVPAVGVFAGDPGAGTATFVMPATVKVAPGGSFNVNVTIYNPHNIDIYSAGAALVWSDASMLGVSAIDGSSWASILPGNGWNNTTGQAWYNAGGSTGIPSQNGTNIIHCVVHFVAGASEGIATVNFTPTVGSGKDTLIYDVDTNDICNWTPGDMQNLTVMIGTPKLTVDVSPAGKGAVKANGTLLVGYPNTTSFAWGQVVSLQAVNPALGWTFDKWTGDAAGSGNTTVTMDTLTKNVTANFVELPPDLSVNPADLAFSGRFGNNTDSKTVTITNTGGGLLKWTKGCPPTWNLGDSWVWNNTYFDGVNGTPVQNTVNMTVTSTSGCNYTTFVTFTPWALRVINSSGMFIPAQMINATVLVDKYSLDVVKEDANLLVNIAPYGWIPANATVTWNFFQVTGHHGWPYSPGKVWGYVVTQDLWVMGVQQPPQPPVTAYGVVTGPPVTVTKLGSPLPVPCWEIVDCLSYLDPANTTFKIDYWADVYGNFVVTADAGTYVYPPFDIRILAGMSDGPYTPPAQPPWLSENKTSGVLTAGQSATINVTASTAGLALGPHSGSFSISAPVGNGCILQKTVNVTLEVLPATTIDVIRTLPADALLPDKEFPGDTFNVTVTFQAPVDEFNSIGLTDLAPAGWAVQTNETWCTPVATWTKGEGNKAEYAWSGESTGYAAGTNFTATYKVTIPATAAQGLNSWPNNDGTKAWAEYWFGAVGPYTSNVTGNWQKVVTVPGKIVGETRDVNAALLTTTLVVLSEEPPEALDEPEDSDSSTAPDAIYKLDVDDTGQYWMEASKYCYYPVDTNNLTGYEPLINLTSTALLAAGYALDFEGDYGLVPKACTMSYAMMSVNHWLFTPTGHPEWQLSAWKAMESVHSWQVPRGCNT
jgi:hypothetical protein